MPRSLIQEFGILLKSRARGNVVEVRGKRKRGIVREVVSLLGENSLFVVTMNGYEDVVKSLAVSDVYIVSSEYFESRTDVRDVSRMRKLIKNIVEELYTEARGKDIVIYRANDLPPVVFGVEQNFVEEEFWRMLTMEIRSLKLKSVSRLRRK